MVEAFLLHWQLILFIIALIFNAGVMYSSMKNKPDETRVNEMIEEKFENHCPFSEKISAVEAQGKAQDHSRSELEKKIAKENEHLHLSLQRVELNLKRICNKLEIEYLQ